MRASERGIILDREVDVSRGDWIVPHPRRPPWLKTHSLTHLPPYSAWPASGEIKATVAWMDNEPLLAAASLGAARPPLGQGQGAPRAVHRLDINALAEEDAERLTPTPSAMWSCCRNPCPLHRSARRACWGSLILVDTASNATAGAVLVN